MALTIEQFVSTVRESGLLGHDLLEGTLREVGVNGPVADPSMVTDVLVARGELTTWQAEKLLAGVERGFFLGKHKLLRLIANGGMSSVYEAEHLLMHRRVALKVLPKSLVGETSFLERFYREAQAVARLNHPNIVRGFDVGQDGDYHFFVMELIEGSSLEDMVEQSGPLPFVQAAELIRQAALGLGHAHNFGMVHRDIKPANLLVAHDGTLKILDLGLVRSLSFESGVNAGLTRLHDESVLGTVDYLSPEQAIDSHNVDIRSDIYSLGCTLYFMLSGGPPFPSGTLAERLMAHQSKAPTPLVVHRPDLPLGLGQIVSRMLAKNPEERYQTPEDVATVLGDWIEVCNDSMMARTDVGRSSNSRKVATAEPVRVQVAVPRRPDKPVDPVPQFGSSHALAKHASFPSSIKTLVKASTTQLRAEVPTTPAGMFIPTLIENWGRWARIVEAFAYNRLLQVPLSDAEYRVIYDDLILICREPTSNEEVDPPTRAILRQIEDLAAPWLSLGSLKSILRSEMNTSILERFLEIDRALRSRRVSVGGPKPSLYKVVVPLVAVTILFAIIPFYWSASTGSKSSTSWFAEVTLALKRWTSMTSEPVNN